MHGITPPLGWWRPSGSEDAPAAQRTFSLDAEYLQHPQNPPTEHYQGNWDVISGTQNDPTATVYELTPNGEGQTYYFEKVDPQHLELIDIPPVY